MKMACLASFYKETWTDRCNVSVRISSHTCDMFSLATSKIGVISKSVGLIFYVCCFTGWGTSAIPSTPSWWCSSGASSSPDPRWPETSGISWWASASNSSPTSEPPPPWDNEAGRGWQAAKRREKKWGSAGYGWWEVPELKALQMVPCCLSLVFAPILKD